MLSIFFDLETSDREVVGQIMNFSFIVCDSSWNIINELSGEVALTRLQIPSPGAILANRIDVLDLQRTAKYTEAEAAKAIAEFLEDVASSAQGKVALVGYNSFKFDIPYLRTVMIRNGISPYIATQKIIHRDLLSVTQKLAATEPGFLRGKRLKEKGGETIEKLSLRLEDLGHSFGLLEGKQKHESRSDVILTIELARAIKERYGLDVRTYDSYEGIFAHGSARSGAVHYALEPQYDLSKGDLSRRIPMTLLDCDRRYSLWINLDKYSAGKGSHSIEFYKNAGSTLIFQRDGDIAVSDGLLSSSNSAISEFSKVNLNNFFTTSTCDIEFDIYRLDFDLITALNRALWFNDKSAVATLKNRDLNALYVRAKLAKSDKLDEKGAEILKQYAIYRYGGKMIASKTNDPAAPERTRFHSTLADLLTDLDDRLLNAPMEDRALLVSLRTYIEKSEIMLVAGSELLRGEGSASQ